MRWSRPRPRIGRFVWVPNCVNVAVCSRGSLYLCGHLHTLGGLMSNMYSRQKTGYLELELADWKDQRVWELISLSVSCRGRWTVTGSAFAKKIVKICGWKGPGPFEKCSHTTVGNCCWVSSVCFRSWKISTTNRWKGDGTLHNNSRFNNSTTLRP